MVRHLGAFRSEGGSVWERLWDIFLKSVNYRPILGKFRGGGQLRKNTLYDATSPPPIAMLHLPLLSLDGSVEGNWPVWCVGSKRTIDNMSQKTCKEARKYTPVLIKDQRPYIADIYFNKLALGSGYSISEIFFRDFLIRKQQVLD